MNKINIFWFRRDLRIQDNHGLFKALLAKNVLPVFIFDKTILNKLQNKKDQRVLFIYQELKKVKKKFEEHGGSLLVLYDQPLDAFKQIIKTYPIDGVFTNRDYEPYATERDLAVEEYLKSQNIKFFTFKDQVIFEKSEVVKNDGKPYTIYTPYSRKWKTTIDKSNTEGYNSAGTLSNLHQVNPFQIPELNEMGFEEAALNLPGREIDPHIISNYGETRDIPAIKGTSRLSVHLRFGTISIRKAVKSAIELNPVFLNELIWRDFYMMILWHFPDVVDKSFKTVYERLEWRNDEKEFKAWCEGKTGYPIVDAGMRELNETGYMHNRLRMITASFLTKHLLIDWRWGEAYFAEKLLDYELSSNNGGWQWAASTGCDAVPYFRIFNPTRQTEKFDKDFKYIKKWVKELDTKDYPQPIVEHKFARERALKAYKKVKG